jgi:DnaJ domain
VDSKKILKEIAKLQKVIWESDANKVAVLAPYLSSAKTALSELERQLRSLDSQASYATQSTLASLRPDTKKSEMPKRPVFGGRLSKTQQRKQDAQMQAAQEADEGEFCAVSDLLAKSAKLKARSLPWAAKILGIPVTADPEQAKSAFRIRAKLIHPDSSKHPSASEAFQSLKFALDDFLMFEQARV